MSTRYPIKIDGLTELPMAIDLVTPVKAEVVNNLREAIVAIETELGVDPSREFGTVRDRLDSVQGRLESLISNINNLNIIISTTSLYFTDVSAMRSFVGTAGSFAVLSGYSSSNDGGGGIFVWSNSSATDNDGTIINGGGFGSSSMGWRRVYDGPLRPEWFGAVGNGTTDDTVALQRACAVIQSNGSGSLEITKFHRIFNSSHTTPIGDFSNCTNIKIIAKGGGLVLDPAVEWALLGIWPCFKFTTCKDVVVDGFTCSGGLLNHATNVGSGVILVDLVNGCVNVSMPYNRLSGAWTGLHSTDNDPPVANHASRGITIGYMEVNGGTYGINGRFSLNDMTVDYLKTTGVYRSFYMVGVSNINANIDSADIAGSHDVIFAALENTDCVNCHVRYTHNRDSGSGITNGTVGVIWQFVQPAGIPGDNTPTSFINCSTELNVKLQSANTLGVACQVVKTTTDHVTEDTTDRGYTIENFKVSGIVDMGGKGSQALVLSPTDNWNSGENASNIDISLKVLNPNVGARALWFNIARALKGPMEVHSSSVPDGYEIELFGRSGAGPYYPPSDELVSVTAVKADNRNADVNAYGLFGGAGIQRIGGWNGSEFYKNTTALGELKAASTDYINLAGTNAVTAKTKADSDGVTYDLLFGPATGAWSLNSAGTHVNRIFEYDGGDALILGDNASSVTQVRAGSVNGVQILSNGATLAQFRKADDSVYFWPDGATLAARIRTTDLYLTTPAVLWAEATPAPHITHNARTTDALPQSLTIKAQDAWVSATGSNRIGGTLYLMGGAESVAGTGNGEVRLYSGNNMTARFITDATYNYFFVGSFAFLEDRSTHQALESAQGGFLFYYGADQFFRISTTGGLSSGETMSPQYVQDARTTDAAAHDFTITPQAPYASATLTNRDPSNFIVVLSAPTNGGTAEGQLRVKRGGTIYGSIGAYPTSTGYGALWLGPNQTASGSTACLFADGAANTYLNVPGGGSIGMAVGGGAVFTTSATLTSIVSPIVYWVETAVSPVLLQAARTTDAATNALTIRSQYAYASATGTNRTPGDLILDYGAPTNSGTTEAAVKVTRNGVHMATIGAYPGSPTFAAIWLGATATTNNGGYSSLWSDGSITYLNSFSTVGVSLNGSGKLTISASYMTSYVPNFDWARSVSSPTIGQDPKIADEATQNFSVYAQDAYASAATNKNGGSLLLKSGAPASGGTGGTVQIYEGASQLCIIGRAASTYCGFSAGGAATSGFGFYANNPGQEIFLQAVGAGSVVSLTSPTVVIGYQSTLRVTNSASTISAWFSEAATPTIYHADRTSDAAVSDLTIRAQSAYSAAVTNVNGANLLLKAGAKASGGGVNGIVAMYSGATQVSSLGAASGDFISFGTTPSTTGALRFSHNSLIFVGRNSLNTLDRYIARWGAVADALQIGDTTNAATYIYGQQIVINNGSANLMAIAGGAGDYIQFGALPADGGQVRLNASGGIWARNAANSGNLYVVQYNGGDALIVGDSSNALTQLRGGYVSLVPTSVTWAETTSAPVLSQAGRSTDAATQILTISAQDAWASAATNKDGGTLIIKGGVPASGGASGKVLMYSTAGTEIRNIDGSHVYGTFSESGIVLSAYVSAAYNTVFTANSSGITAISGYGSTYVKVYNAITYLGNTNALQWETTTTTPSITQATPISDATTHDFTIAPQAPYASATGTNRNPGNLIVSLARPTNSGTVVSGLKINYGGSLVAQIGPYNDPATYSSIWLGPGITPSNQNFAFLGNGTTASFLNVPTGGTIYLSINGTAANGLSMNATTFAWAEGTSGPIFGHAARTADTATSDLTIKAQNAYASAATNKSGGNILLSAGTSTGDGTSGIVRVIGGTNLGTSTWFEVGTALATYGTSVVNYTNNLMFGSAVASALIGQGDLAADTAPNDLTIKAQDSYSAAAVNLNGGNLVLKGGAKTGAGSPGYVKITNGTSNFVASFGYVSAPSSYGGLYLLANATAPTANNFAILSNGTDILFNAPGAGLLEFGVANTQVFNVNSGAVVAFGEVYGPIIGITARTSDAVTHNLTIQGQDAFGSATVNKSGGNILYKAGLSLAGTGASRHKFYNGDAGSPVEFLHLYSTSNFAYLEGVETQGIYIKIAQRTSDASTSALNIIGQAAFASATGTNRNGGSVNIQAGSAAAGGTNGSVYLADTSGNPVLEVTATGDILFMGSGTGGAIRIGDGSATLAFFAGTAQAKLTVTGSRGGNAALQSLLSQLASYGLITDSSSA